MKSCLVLAFFVAILGSPAQGQSIHVISNGWGLSYRIEEPENAPILTRASLERMAEFRYTMSVGLIDRKIDLIVEDGIFDPLVAQGIFAADGKLKPPFFEQELPEGIPSESRRLAAELRGYQVQLPTVKIHILRMSEVLNFLHDKGVLDARFQFVRDVQFDENGSEKHNSIVGFVKRFRVRSVKSFEDMPQTRGYVVRHLLTELVTASVGDPQKSAQSMRGFLASSGQIWQILSEAPSLQKLVRDAGLPVGDGQSVATAVIDALLSQPLIMNKLSEFAGEEPRSMDDMVETNQSGKRFNLLKKIPDAVFLKMASAIREKIRTMDLSGVDAIKGITSLQAGGDAGELAQLLQKTLGHYFKNLAYKDKVRLAHSYLALDPRSSVERQIAAALQATGPFVQKLFQLIGDEVNSETLQRASAELKASVKPFPASVSRSIIERDLGQPIDEIFSKFDDDPVSAGTVGQIHLATLRATGEEVVVKVLRPGVREHFLREVELIKEPLDNPVHRAIVDAFAQTILREMDLRNEAQNTDEAGFMNRPKHGVQAVKRIDRWPATQNVLILSRAAGKPLDKYALFQKIPEAGGLEKLTEAQVKAMIKQFSRVVRVWFGNALFGNGKFHGDFHTGNAMMDSTPEKPAGMLTAIDFGNFQTLTVEHRRQFLMLLLSTFKKDASQTASIVASLGGLSPAQTDTLTRRLDAAEWRTSGANIRMAAALGHATQMGASLPPEFVNFARSKQMLETAMKIVNKNLEILDPKNQRFARISPYNLFMRGAVDEIAKSLVDPKHPGRGEQRVLNAKFLGQVSKEIVSAPFVRSCRELVMPPPEPLLEQE